MSEKANPVLVGGFALVGLVIAIAGLLVFGGGKMFEKKFECVAYFEESLSGLDIGAPIEFKGVRIGTVTDVKLIIDRESHKIIRPVSISLEPSRVSFSRREENKGFSEDGFERAVKNGLRARLASQSMLTGKLKIELDMIPDDEIVLKGNNSDIHEIPTVVSPITAVKKKFENIPLTDIAYNIDKIALNISAVLDDKNTKSIPQEINKTLIEIQKLVKNADKQLSVIGDNFTLLASNANKLLEDVDGQITPASENIASIAESARLSMKNANKLIIDLSASFVPLMTETKKAIGNIGDAVDERSTFRIELEELLDNLGKAAKAVNELANSIEQNPESLLRGKK